MSEGMQNLFYIGVGGFSGALLRYGLSTLMQRLAGGTFPIGTMGVNLLGCLCIGLLAGFDETRHVLSEQWRLFVFVGVLGSFTTFSTFGLDAFKLLREGAMVSASIYIGGQVIVGLAVVCCGFYLGRWS
mgnify:CR=1 FL=1